MLGAENAVRGRHDDLLAAHNALGYEAGDTNVYRYVGNNPTNATDPAGLFEYKHVSGPTFRGGYPIGYLEFRLDIVYPKKVGLGGMPLRGSFIQVNTVTTTVVTCDDKGKLNATVRVTYILDRPRLVGRPSFNDRNNGPGFDKKLAKDAILVFSHVVKEHGFSDQLLDDIRLQKELTQAEAEVEKKRIDPKYDKGEYTYSYLWADADKPKGVVIKDRGKAILAILNKETQELLKGMGVNLDTYKGQKLVGDAGVSEEAGLDGK